MGSGSSRVGRRPSVPCRASRFFSSLVCGASASQSPSQMEEYPDKSPIKSVENLAPANDAICSSPTGFVGSESGFSISNTEVGASSESSISSFEDNFSECGFGNIEAGYPNTCVLESEESVAQRVSAASNSSEPHLSENSASASTSCEQSNLESLSANSRIGLDVACEANNSEDTTISLICPDEMNSSSVEQEYPAGNSVEDHENEVIGINPSASGPLSVFSDYLSGLHSFGDDSAQDATSPISELLVSDSDQGLRVGSVLHVDVVSISSNILSGRIAEISNREARRNSRRIFWDTLSRRSFRRHNDDSTIVFTTGHAADIGSHERWLLDLGGDLHYDGVGNDSENLGPRRHHRNERWLQLRSEASERSQNEPDERGQQTALCPSGLHPNGTCSCDSFFMGEESGVLASISRIVVLAEALFEVLDEIHRQPLSFPLSMAAPESVVNSFPLRNHSRSKATESEPSDMEQCYICLAEYEDGDKIRVLPCHHEYHVQCVDKWLTEIHGVCPLCRCNVCEGGSPGSTSSDEVPSQ
ncbi:uncharacterized protein LOC127786976 isoform X1 [Diospyros lotus]|uniref:uncharacterized protein LOC127786976 isoform X1 n=1 Tax=Diospyros lotus TaxID=55363 RepID=UPI00225437CD|nr:uncharacterized protein LOC127786976 isoform X1 [Diospyros lotus]XP_052170752.1 uncharacterized protein LOC127786976 isoform X1 [Diospyros lotus]XP_052170754.1 uncharacterized protein LOC127786976 isoform X1 [Diospyros lotus]